MSNNNIERNKLDYLLTDIMPVEVSELFSFYGFYEYLLVNYKELNKIVKQLKKVKAENGNKLFSANWATMPLKYNVLKGVDSLREINLVQPLSALNMYLFVECYQKELLTFLSEHASFSLRYHKKNSNLYYKKRVQKISQYFEKTSKTIEKRTLQQTGAYYKIHRFNSVSSFTNSRIWQMSNFKFDYFAKMDYKACFRSIYSHTYKWIIEKSIGDSKDAKNTNMFVSIDRIMQNINGKSSNGLIVGPEFSRMIAEILLQEIDCEVQRILSSKGLEKNSEYTVFRYVDDIFIFSNTPQNIDFIIRTFENVAQKYLLQLNELKLEKSKTPVSSSGWLGRTRALADKVADLFNRKSEIRNFTNESDKYLLKEGYVFYDRLKDDFITLINDFPKDKRYIVSFMLSTLLNNISNKKDGYNIFKNGKGKKALSLLDFALYIYSFCPCFEHTQRIISMIIYMNDEAGFMTGDEEKKKLQKLFRKYAFIFEKGNLNDICNLLLLFSEYKMSLLGQTEAVIVERLKEENNPILWANYLIYSKYNKPYYEEIKNVVTKEIRKNVMRIGNDNILLYKEFWYIIVFYNYPELETTLREHMKSIIESLVKSDAKNPNDKCINLMCDYMLQRKSNQFFCWGHHRFSVGKQIAFRTYERTLFKGYKNKRSIELYGSLDS